MGEILAVFPRFTYGYTSHEQLIAIFEKHQTEIERIEVAFAGMLAKIPTCLILEESPALLGLAHLPLAG